MDTEYEFYEKDGDTFCCIVDIYGDMVIINVSSFLEAYEQCQN